MFYGLIALAGITGYLALRSSFPLFRFAATIPWIALIAYITDSYSGENWTVIAILGCIAMICALPLSQLGRDVRQQRTYGKGGQEQESSLNFKFKLPDWLKDKTSPAYRAKQRDQSLDEYRESLHRALNPKEKRK